MELEDRIATLLGQGAFAAALPLAEEALEEGVAEPRTLEQLAWQAARVLGKTVAWAPPDDPVVQAGLQADAAAAAGRPEDARRHASAALRAAADPVRRARSRRRLAELDLRWGDPAAVIEPLESLAAAAALAGDAYGEARARAGLAEAAALLGDADRAREEALAAHRPAEQGGWRDLRHRTAALCRALGAPVGRVPPDARAEARALDLLARTRESDDPHEAAGRLAAGRAALRELPAANRPFVERLATSALDEVELVWVTDGVGPPLLLAPGAREAWRGGRPVARWKRSRLLYALFETIAAAGGALERRDLFEQVWETPYRPPHTDNQLFVAINRVRARVDLGDLELVSRDDGRYCLEPQPPVVRWLGDARRLVPARASAETRTDLPAPPGPLIGRTLALERVESHLDDRVLTTIVGPPGVGKTRVALEAAHRFDGRAWWCALASATDTDELVRIVATELRCSARGPDPVGAVRTALASLRDGLVVLDNVEQIAGVEDVLRAWSDGAPGCRLLVTSRRALELDDEEAYVLQPLSVAEATELFRARSEGDAPKRKVRALIKRVHRNALAIEMAAALTRWTSVDDLLEREGVGDLEGAIAWSWELLRPDQREALSQLTVFRDGFTLTAAEAVLALGADAPSVLEVVQELVGHSLLRRWRPARDPGQVRFDLYPSVQAFAAARLADPASTEARHTAWAGQLARRLHGPLSRGEPDALRQGRLEFANLRAAFQRGCADEASIWCLLAIDAYGLARVATPDHDAWLRDGIERARDLSPELRWRLQYARSRLLASEVRHGEQGRAAEEALALAEAAGSPTGRALCLVQLAMGEPAFGTEEAGAWLETAHRLAVEARDAGLEGFVLARRGAYSLRHLRHDEALAHTRASLALLDRGGDRHGSLFARSQLVGIQRRVDDWAGIDVASEELHRLATELDASFWVSFAAFHRGMVQSLHHRFERALELHRHALRVARYSGSRSGEAVALTFIGRTQLDLGRWPEAEQALQEARALAAPHGDWVRGDVHEALGLLRLDQGHVEGALAENEAAGRDFTMGDAVASNTFLRGVVLWSAGRLDEAEQALADASAVFAAQDPRPLRGLLAELARSAVARLQGRDDALPDDVLPRVDALDLPELRSFVAACAGEPVGAGSVLVRVAHRAAES